MPSVHTRRRGSRALHFLVGGQFGVPALFVVYAGLTGLTAIWLHLAMNPEGSGIAALLRQLGEQGIDFRDLHSSESSLEEIFVGLVRAGA